MLECKLNLRDVSRSILLVVTLLILCGSFGSAEASVRYSLIKEPRTTVSSPSVILQNGIAGTSTIYTNNTSAKVTVSPNVYWFRFDNPSPSVSTNSSKSLLDTQGPGGEEKKEMDVYDLNPSGYFYRTNETASYIAGNWELRLYRKKSGGPSVTFSVYLEKTNVNGSTVLSTIGSQTNITVTDDAPTLQIITFNVSATSFTTNDRLRLKFVWVSGVSLQICYNGLDSENYGSRLMTPNEQVTYDYVLRVNNTVTDSWQIRLKADSDSNKGRLKNCTIYFHNSTDGTSNQIIIINGEYTQQAGSWYDLASTDTDYIAMAASTNSTGTSYIYAYLEIQTPDTTTYAQYIITFEIT